MRSLMEESGRMTTRTRSPEEVATLRLTRRVRQCSRRSLEGMHIPERSRRRRRGHRHRLARRMLEHICTPGAMASKLTVDVLKQRALQRRIRPEVSCGESEDEQRRQGQEQPEPERHLWTWNIAGTPIRRARMWSAARA